MHNLKIKNKNKRQRRITTNRLSPKIKVSLEYSSKAINNTIKQNNSIEEAGVNNKFNKINNV